MSTLPAEAEKLLAAAPEEFVSERTRIARELKDAGRPEDAVAVAELRKPPLVVLAVNRAARDRPKAARAAAEAARRVRTSQVSGEQAAYRRARDDLEGALALLSDVAVARLSRGKPASEQMRRRVSDVLRASVADDATRDLLARGALVEERGSSGFTAYEGMALPSPARGQPAAKKPSPRDEKLRARKKQLEAELKEAKLSLRAAERRRQQAAREWDAAAKAVASLEAQLGDLRAPLR